MSRELYRRHSTATADKTRPTTAAWRDPTHDRNNIATSSFAAATAATLAYDDGSRTSKWTAKWQEYVTVTVTVDLDHFIVKIKTSRIAGLGELDLTAPDMCRRTVVGAAFRQVAPTLTICNYVTFMWPITTFLTLRIDSFPRYFSLDHGDVYGMVELLSSQNLTLTFMYEFLSAPNVLPACNRDSQAIIMRGRGIASPSWRVAADWSNITGRLAENHVVWRCGLTETMTIRIASTNELPMEIKFYAM
jgi:hypothetical protein